MYIGVVLAVLVIVLMIYIIALVRMIYIILRAGAAWPGSVYRERGACARGEGGLYPFIYIYVYPFMYVFMYSCVCVCALGGIHIISIMYILGSSSSSSSSSNPILTLHFYQAEDDTGGGVGGDTGGDVCGEEVGAGYSERTRQALLRLPAGNVPADLIARLLAHLVGIYIYVCVCVCVYVDTDTDR